MEKFKTKVLPLSKIKSNQQNPRIISESRLKKLINSILAFPRMLNLRPIVINDQSIVLGGNMRLTALGRIAQWTEDELLAKLETLPEYNELPDGGHAIREYWQEFLNRPQAEVVIADDLTEDEKKQFIIKDNVSFGDWDYEELENWDSAKLEDWGVDMMLPDFGGEGSEKWGKGEGKPQTEVKEDDFKSDEHYETKVKAGEVWQLGKHRLMCGDSTDADAVAKLMNGERADIAFTSPPYNLMSGFKSHPNQADGYLGGENVYNEYSDDRNDEDYAKFLTDVLTNSLSNSDDVFFNIGYTKGALVGTALFLGQNAKHFCGAVTWVKSGCYMPFFPIQHGMLGNITEPVYIFSQQAGRKTHHPQWKQGEVSYNIVETKNAAGNEYSKENSATFPVEFAFEFIKRFSEKSVLDVFGGTGTTMIAAEQLGRKCFMMELDPHYCTVIIARWERLTGQKAKKLNPKTKI